MHPTGPFSIPAINNYIPEKLKPWIIILFVIVFQFSGGVYLATANEMVGSTELMQEDVLMAGYASLVGMALTFAVMMRLKMRITSKATFMICAIALIIANIICLYTTNVFVLVATCFFAGIIRMWATFECNSTIQLWITPKRDLPIFFCYIYLLVQGVILIGGSGDLYITLFANWHHIHWLVIGALLAVALITMLIFNDNRIMPPFPLFGIDWLGAFLWGMILLCINFIGIYGAHYDWWYSSQIQTATVFLIVLLALNIYRASFIRHPFISLDTFKYKVVYQSLFLYLLIDLFISPSHFIEHIYFEAVLGYDMWHLMKVNWISWIGVILGAAFTYWHFALRHKSFQSTFGIGFGAIFLYLIMMYFMVDKNTSMELLAIPMILRNFGYVIIAIVLISNLLKVPFHHFF
jgi:DHA2 family multidrug resistance protein